MIETICAGATRIPYLAVTGLPESLPAVVWAVFARFEWDVFLPYLTAVLLLVVGLGVALKKGPAKTNTLEKITLFGPVFIAMPMAVFGLEHYLDPVGVGRAIPSWIPAHTFWALFVGTCLIVGSLSIVFQKYAGLSAGLFGIMLLCFEVLLHIPRVLAAPHNRLFWAIALRDFCFSCGALAFAATRMKERAPRAAHWLISLTGAFIGITVIFFAVSYFLHPELLPGVPLRQLTPSFIPGGLLWGYLTSVVYAVAGVCLLIKKKERVAAAWGGVFVLFTVIFFCVPTMVQHGFVIGTGLNVPVDTLLLSGALLGLAGSQAQEPGKAKTQSMSGVQGVRAS